MQTTQTYRARRVPTPDSWRGQIILTIINALIGGIVGALVGALVVKAMQ
jgi:hypothetical protein